MGEFMVGFALGGLCAAPLCVWLTVRAYDSVILEIGARKDAAVAEALRR